MLGEGDDLVIGDEDSDGAAFVYLQLNPQDVGDLNGRTQRPEFINRRPICISDFDQTGLTIEISNSGETISDVVTLEYQVVFCTLASHGPQEGFTTSHASEEQSDQLEKYLSMDVIDAGGAVRRRLDFPQLGFSGLKNVYFRARVSTLWSPSVPMDQWDFASDAAVTEAHFRAGP